MRHLRRFEGLGHDWSVKRILARYKPNPHYPLRNPLLLGLGHAQLRRATPDAVLCAVAWRGLGRGVNVVLKELEGAFDVVFTCLLWSFEAAGVDFI